MAIRNYCQSHDQGKAKEFHRFGVNGEIVGLIGMGMIGRRQSDLFKGFGFMVIAQAHYLSDEQAAEVGVEKVSLEEIFSRAYIVSNSVPDFPSTKKVLGRALFESMREGSTFINTGRGAQVDEADLIGTLKKCPDITDFLDVTFPEPPGVDSGLWILPNVWISPHVGRCVGDEVVRMADCTIEELQAWESGKPLRYRITKEVLGTMG